MWVLAVILVAAMLIPLAAILADSPLGKSLARRVDGRVDGGQAPEVHDMQRRVELMETEIEDLNRSVAGMREELQFMQRLLEDPRRKKPTT
jgi:HAMP domain-containing protein